MTAMRRFFLLACLLLGGCTSPQLLSGTPDGAWVKAPLINFGNPDTPAAEHCARYGKQAIFRGSLGEDDPKKGKYIHPTGTHLPIRVYDCR